MEYEDSGDVEPSISGSTNVFKMESVQLESGEILHDVEIRYCTYGALNAERNNVIMVCHSLTMGSAVGTWPYWKKLLCPGQALDVNKYFVASVNVIGSQFGSTGPRTVNPKTGKPYGPTFPTVTVLDTVRAHIRLFKEKLNILEVHCVIGGSLGGMQALVWALEGGTYVKRGVFLCCGPEISAWQMGLNELQRRAIHLDPGFKDGHYGPEDLPLQGLSLARQLGMMSYRSHAAYVRKFERRNREGAADEDRGKSNVQSYLEHVGSTFSSRFDPNTYLVLVKMLESHNVGRNQGGIENALNKLTQSTLIIGINSDILYPVEEQEILHKLIPNSTLKIIDSSEGHDGFLIEVEAVSALVSEFLNTADTTVE